MNPSLFAVSTRFVLSFILVASVLTVLLYLLSVYPFAVIEAELVVTSLTEATKHLYSTCYPLRIV